MCLTIDQAMATDAGRYTLTITPSDATLAETMEPVVLNTRVDINPKIRSRVRYFLPLIFIESKFQIGILEWFIGSS